MLNKIVSLVGFSHVDSYYEIVRTNASVEHFASDAALEEAGAAVAAVHAVVLPETLVPAHAARHGHRQSAA